MSHPTWVRGLKQSGRIKAWYDAQVAPYVGAWIETRIYESIRNVVKVAPYVGAWIETQLAGAKYVCKYVAPYVGAWIETRKSYPHNLSFESHPTWVRGLKQ